MSRVRGTPRSPTPSETGSTWAACACRSDPGFEVQLNLAGDQIVGAVVLLEESALQVHAFAAPKRSGMWDEVRAELAEGVKTPAARRRSVRGRSASSWPGRFPSRAESPGRPLPRDRRPALVPRAVITGVAARRGGGRAAGGVVRDIVVVRGDEPMAPKEAIALRLPPEARNATEQQPTVDDLPGSQPFRAWPGDQRDSLT